MTHWVKLLIRPFSTLLTLSTLCLSTRKSNHSIWSVRERKPSSFCPMSYIMTGGQQNLTAGVVSWPTWIRRSNSNTAFAASLTPGKGALLRMVTENWKASSNVLVGDAFIGGDVVLLAEVVGLVDGSAGALATIWARAVDELVGVVVEVGAWSLVVEGGGVWTLVVVERGCRVVGWSDWAFEDDFLEHLNFLKNFFQPMVTGRVKEQKQTESLDHAL